MMTVVYRKCNFLHQKPAGNIVHLKDTNYTDFVMLITSFDRADSILAEMRSTFGLKGSRLLCINSSPDGIWEGDHSPWFHCVSWEFINVVVEFDSIVF